MTPAMEVHFQAVFHDHALGPGGIVPALHLARYTFDARDGATCKRWSAIWHT